MKITVTVDCPCSSVANYKFELESGKIIKFSDVAWECSDGSAVLDFIRFLKAAGEDIEVVEISSYSR